MLTRTPVHRIGTLSTLLANAALYCAHVTHLQTPAAALILSGSLFRCLSFPCTIYGDQCLHRVAGALPELQDAHKDYCSIADHPDAISWEKRVAAQKLKNDRERIFGAHRTNNVKMVVPHVVGAALSLYCLGVPAQQLGTFFLQDVGLPIVSPFAVSFVMDPTAATTPAAAALSTGHFTSTSAVVTTITAATTSAPPILFTIDPTLSVAAALTCWNVCQHLRQRTGFNTRLDEWLRGLRNATLWSYGAVAVASLLCGPLSYLLSVPAVSFFPPYLAPVWLGMSATTTMKVLLVNKTAPGRALCRLPPYPPQHGTYGEESTAVAHEYRLEFTGVDQEETRHAWQTQKRILEYECDLRIHQSFTRLGLFDDLDELSFEKEKLEEKRKIARGRRLAREEGGQGEESSETEEPHTPNVSAQPQQDAGLQAARQRRREQRRSVYEDAASAASAAAKSARGTGDWRIVNQNFVAPSKELDGAYEAHMDRQQEEENRRRKALRKAREEAWRQKH